jgi:nicotinate-nucleotide adenylyltransferase
LTFSNRVGVFGGAFDPPHLAHLRVAQEALRQCGLRRVVLVPNGVAPEKGDETEDKEDRLRMVQILVRGRRGLSASRIEIDREGPSYTIDTIRAMKDDHPEGLCFILGADRLLGIETWRESRTLVKMVPFIVAPRPGVDVTQRGPGWSGAAVFVLDMPPMDLSSSWVREKAARGLELEPWVPRGVAEYIRERGLYQRRASGNRD